MNASEIERILRERFQAKLIEVVDESPFHAGHGLSGEGGHFSVLIVSPVFSGKSLIDRHRMVYETLSMPNNPSIHALSMKTLTPEEFEKKST